VSVLSILILEAAFHAREHCNPVEHILIEFVIGPLAAVLVALFFRGSKNLREELPEYLVGGLLSGILIAVLFCFVIVK
jgi:hypothetical protein